MLAINELTAPEPAHGGERTALRVEILGPLRVIVDGAVIDVRGVRRRAVLALLALRPGQVVTVDVMLEVLWSDDPPPSGRQAVMSLVSRVRGHLGDHAPLLERAGGGYRLAPEAWDVDLVEVRDRLDRARQTVGTDPEAAVEDLQSALDLWRGPALEEFESLETLAMHATTIRELRFTVEDELLAARLRTGATSELVENTLQAVIAEPLREARQLHHVRALALSGRATDALRAAHDYRQRLAEETGLEPSATLADLEALVASGELAISGHEPALSPPMSTGSERSGGRGRLDMPTRWPRYGTQLHGRSAETHRLLELLEAEQLVSVVGPGGIGKTRLVAATADLLIADSDPDSVVYVALAALADADPNEDPSRLADAVAGAIGLRPSPGQTALEACNEWFSGRQRILILDNCEHVLEPARELIDRLMQIPDLRIIATTRMPVGLPTECILRVGPLPEVDQTRAQEVARQPAIALFVERAQRVIGEPLDHPDAMTSVATIVQRLDRVPLAIELAAGRLSALSLADLEQRLDDALDLLSGERPSVDARHRSLRATLDWSYRLLTPDERRLLVHLAVFANGFDLTAVDAVAATLYLPGDGLGDLAGLVDASIVQIDRDSGPRYSITEAVRSFALERHRRHGGDSSPVRTLLRWAVETAAEIDVTSRGPGEPDADRRIRAELGNFRAAHAAAIERDDLETATAIVVALDRPASFRDLPEVWTWARSLASRPDLDGHPRHAEVLGAAAEAAWLSGDLDASQELADRGLGIDPEWGRCHYAKATVALFRGDPDRAQSSFLAAAEQDRTALANAALAASYRGDTATAHRLIDEGMAWAVDHGGPTDVAVFHYVTGETLNPKPQALDSYERAVELAQRSGAGFVEGIATVGMATIQAAQGELHAALKSYGRLVHYWSRTGNWTQQWTTLRNLAHLLHQVGDIDVATTLETAAASADQASIIATATTAPSAAATPLSRSEAVRVAIDAIAALVDD